MRLLLVLTLALVPALVLTIRGSSTGEVIGHFVLFGAVFGAVLPLRTVVMGDSFAGPRFGALMGVQATAIAVGRAAGPALVGWFAVGPPGYPVAMTVLTGLLVLSVGLVAAALRMGGPRTARGTTVTRDHPSGRGDLS